MLDTFIRTLFTPAVKIMGWLRYWQKFVILTILFTVPVGYALFSFNAQIDKSIAFSEKEVIGVQYLSPVLALLQNLQQHRGMASAYLRGDSSFLPRLIDKEKNIEENFSLIFAEDQKFGPVLETTEALKTLQKKWVILEKSYAQLTPKESAHQHTEFISDILTLIYLVGDTSNLILDPDLDSYYLMNTVVNTLPNLSENLGQARAFTLSVQDPKKISDLERKDIINYSNIAHIADEKIKRDMSVVFKSNGTLSAALENPLEETLFSVRSFATLLDTFVNTNAVEIPSSEYYTFSTGVINTNFSLMQSLSVSLTDLLNRRIERFRNEKRIIIEITVVSYMLILYFFIGFYLLVTRTVREFEDIAQRLTNGKIEEAPTLSKDELGDVGKSFNTVGRALIASTQDLHGKVDELERFNKLMINRELKMIELKKEIEELKKKNDQNHT